MAAIFNEDEQQVINWFHRLPPERRQLVLQAMTQGSASETGQRRAEFEFHLRELASKEGLDWGAMNAEQKADFSLHAAEVAGREFGRRFRA